MKRSPVSIYAPSGMAIADLGFTVQNGTVVRSPNSSYSAAQGGDLTLSRVSSITPVSVTIPITNFGEGNICFAGIAFSVSANSGGGTITSTFNGVATSSTTRICIPKGQTRNLVFTYTGGDGNRRGSYDFLDASPGLNTRLPFSINSFRVVVTTSV